MKKRLMLLILAIAALCALSSASAYWELKGDRFSCGLAAVKINGKYGYMDSDGVLALPPRWGNAEDFMPYGLARVSVDLYSSGTIRKKKGVINTEGEYIIPLTECEGIYFDSSDKQAYIELFYKDDEGNGWYELFDRTGNRISDKRWQSAVLIDPFIFCVADENGKYGYYEVGKGLIIPCQFDYAYEFSNGLSRVELQGKNHYINTDGEIVISGDWDQSGNFSPYGITYVRWAARNEEGEAAGKTYSFIDQNGKPISEDIWDDIHFTIRSNLSAVARFNESGNLKWGFINTEGQVVIPLIWDDVTIFRDGVARAGVVSELNGTSVVKYGLIDESGTVLSEPQWDFLYEELGDYIPVAKADADGNKHFGCIDKTGRLVVPLEWNWLGDIRNGVATVRTEDRQYGLLDINTGRMLLEPQRFSIGKPSDERIVLTADSEWKVMDLNCDVLFTHSTVQDDYAHFMKTDLASQFSGHWKSKKFAVTAGGLYGSAEEYEDFYFDIGYGGVCSEAVDREAGNILLPARFEYTVKEGCMTLFNDGSVLAMLYISQAPYGLVFALPESNAFIWYESEDAKAAPVLSGKDISEDGESPSAGRLFHVRGKVAKVSETLMLLILEDETMVVIDYDGPVPSNVKEGEKVSILCRVEKSVEIERDKEKNIKMRVLKLIPVEEAKKR